ncbi:hypothetical protein LCGC14_1313630 [marine sediment metagenome]|uniref:VWFA domain-containing protein n=1 Tax=marine sediment metagenome TaxID=412755 RepID=A0A0F9L6P3_9ZZZZ
MRGVLTVLLALGATGAAAECRQALALGLDVSASVDGVEYGQQLGGLATALEDAAVQQALFAIPGAWVDLAVFEWSGPAFGRIIQHWTTLSDPAALADVTAKLRVTQREASDPSTAIGSAMRFGAALLAQRAACWRAVLDLSGDGLSNTGPRPRDVIPTLTGPTLSGLTVNGLAIADPGGGSDLAAYYRAEVMTGLGAFVEEARGFEDYAEAMRRKLLRELQVLAVSGRVLPPAQ